MSCLWMQTIRVNRFETSFEVEYRKNNHAAVAVVVVATIVVHDTKDATTCSPAVLHFVNVPYTC